MPNASGDVRGGFLSDDTPPLSELVETPHGTVEVRELTAEQFDAYLEVVEEAMAEKDDNKRRRLRTAALVWAGTFEPGTGDRVFEKGDIPVLAAMPFQRLAPIFRVVDRLNRIPDPKDQGETATGFIGGSPGGTELPSASSNGG